MAFGSSRRLRHELVHYVGRLHDEFRGPPAAQRDDDEPAGRPGPLFARPKRDRLPAAHELSMKHGATKNIGQLTYFSVGC